MRDIKTIMLLAMLTIGGTAHAQLVLDTLIGECGSVPMRVANGDMCVWMPCSGLDDCLSFTPTATPEGTTTYTGIAYVRDSNMARNGDFEEGNAYFITDYVYNSSSLWSENTYMVGPNAHNYHSGFASMGDHTSGSGRYLIVNGAGSSSNRVWQQGIDLVPGEMYEIILWATNLNGGSPPRLQFTLNGIMISPEIQVSQAMGWRQYSFRWVNDSLTQGDIAILNRNTVYGGNDFGLDDISIVGYQAIDTAIYRIRIDRDTTYYYGCDYYIYRGQTYRQTTSLTQRITTASGCDSLVVTTINIGQQQTDTTTAEVCTRYYWEADHTIYTASGEYEYHARHDTLCDTHALLRLTILDCPTNQNPDNVDWPRCTSRPPGDAFGMREMFSCSGVNSMSTPMLGDVDGDGVPEILACAFSGDPGWGNRILVIDGRNGNLKYTLNVPTYRTSGQMMSIADVDADGTAEFFMVADDSYLYCYSAIGAGQIWRSSVRLNARYLTMTADVNGDGRAEVVCGPYIFDALTGTLLLQGSCVSGGWGYGAPHTSSGYGRPYYMQALADLDHDGTLEFCVGNTVYKPTLVNTTGTAGNTWQVLRQAERIPQIERYDGQSFLADFDNDGDVDVCVIGFSSGNRVDVYVWEGQTSDIVGYYTVYIGGGYNGTMSPSIPFCGDLDGNGTPEIIFNYPDGMRAFAYDPTTANHIRLMHHATRFGEMAGFTVFDFNQDGKEEIVYRNTTQMYIVDGETLRDLCAPLTTYSGTICEYTIVGDANGDGHANIIVNHAHRCWGCGGYNADGKVSVFGSAQLDAWGSARKVWNQWPYSSVHINDDLTVPRYQIDLATIFPNGKKPFNGFLRQMPHVDQNGDIYVEVSNLEPDTANISYADNGATVSIDYTNHGDSRINAPYSITLYCDHYRGDVIATYPVENTLQMGNNDSHSMFIPMEQLCHLQCDSIVVALNDGGHGIGQHGDQQPECDTSNNIYIVPLRPFVPKGDTTRLHACDTFTWNRSHMGVALSSYFEKSIFVWDSLLDRYGCDSIRALDLNVTYRFHDSVEVTVCDEYTWDVNGQRYTASTVDVDSMMTIDQCDSVWKLYLTVNYSYTFYPKATVADTLLPFHFIDRSYYNDVRNDHFHYLTVDRCDSDYYFSLYVDYHRLSCDGYLQFPSVVTPNGDGVNDLFEVVNLLWQDCYPVHTLSVYNRWGMRVYHHENIRSREDFWNPAGMPDGTYYYHFRGRGATQTIERSGVVEVKNN